MKPILLVLTFIAAGQVDGLGVGLDVLPEAFAFAANRLNFSPALRLISCKSTTCRWDVGNGVGLTASVPDQGLNVDRIEANVDFATATRDTVAMTRFEKTCLSIVALVAPNESIDETHAIAGSIAFLPKPNGSVEISDVVSGASFYGRRVLAEQKGAFRESMSCGAVAISSVSRNAQ